MYVHAGSSSEYGDNASGPKEDGFTAPNSHYAVSKVAAANLLYYYGKKLGVPCANLRLYSVFGPMEDSSRLIHAVVRYGLEHKYPEFVNSNTSRDFVYVDDACEAFFDAALNLRPDFYGESFNIGTGRKTTIGDIVEIARKVFEIEAPPQFTMEGRHWDLSDWYADVKKAARVLHIEPDPNHSRLLLHFTALTSFDFLLRNPYGAKRVILHRFGTAVPLSAFVSPKTSKANLDIAISM
jgi:dolichol-phosphate mannosyltransferase